MICLIVDKVLWSWVAHGSGRKFVASDLISTLTVMMCLADWRDCREFVLKRGPRLPTSLAEIVDQEEHDVQDCLANHDQCVLSSHMSLMVHICVCGSRGGCSVGRETQSWVCPAGPFPRSFPRQFLGGTWASLGPHPLSKCELPSKDFKTFGVSGEWQALPFNSDFPLVSHFAYKRRSHKHRSGNTILACAMIVPQPPFVYKRYCRHSWIAEMREPVHSNFYECVKRPVISKMIHWKRPD